MLRTIPAALVCAVAAALVGCAGDGPTPSSGSSAFDILQREIFDQSCTSGPCHNPQTAAADLILTEGFSFDDLVEVAATNESAQQQGLERVTPFDVVGSFLLAKVEGPGPGEGSRMPLGAAPLTESEIQLIRDWIASGAPGPETPGPSGSPSATPSPTTVPATPTATATLDATALPTTAPPLSPTATAVAPTNTPAVTLQQVQDEIFTPSCAVQFCHSGDFPSAQVSLEEGQSFDQLVGVVPSNGAAAADGLLRVDAGDPDNSFLIVKVEGPDRLELGSRMPLAFDPLTQEQIDLLRAWVASLQTE